MYPFRMPKLSVFTVIFISTMLSACVAKPTMPAAEIVSIQSNEAQLEKYNAQRIVAAPASLFEAGQFMASNGVQLQFRHYRPSQAAAQKLPLILMLHGSGAIGADNEKQLGWFARSWAHPDIAPQFPAHVLVPQLPARGADYFPASDAGESYSIARPPLLATFELVEQMRRRDDVDSQRIYVVGFSMGASGAWNAAALRPDLFAAAVPIAGIAPARNLAPALANTPILIVHGNADKENKIESDQAMFQAIVKANLKANSETQKGSAQIRFIEYIGLDHTVPADMVFDTAWRSWLFAQRRK